MNVKKLFFNIGFAEYFLSVDHRLFKIADLFYRQNCYILLNWQITSRFCDTFRHTIVLSSQNPWPPSINLPLRQWSHLWTNPYIRLWLELLWAIEFCATLAAVDVGGNGERLSLTLLRLLTPDFVERGHWDWTWKNKDDVIIWNKVQLAPNLIIILC